MRSSVLSTRSTSPSSPRKELSQPLSSPVTRSTLVAISSFLWRSSFPSPSPLQVLRSPREPVVLAVVDPCVVDAAVDAALLAAVVPPEAVVASAAVVSVVVVSPEVVVVVASGVAGEVPVEVEASADVRQSLSCLVLSYYGVLGKRELLQELFCLDILVHPKGKDLPVCRGCRLDPAIEWTSYENRVSCQNAHRETGIVVFRIHEHLGDRIGSDFSILRFSRG